MYNVYVTTDTNTGSFMNDKDQENIMNNFEISIYEEFRFHEKYYALFCFVFLLPILSYRLGNK